MTETPRNSPPALQKDADLACSRVPQAKTPVGIEEFWQLDGHQIYQLVQNLRRLDTRTLNELTLALREVLTQAVSVSEEDPDGRVPAPMVARSVSRQDVQIQASAATPPSMASAPPMLDQLLENRASTSRRPRLVLLSACVGLGMAVGIVLFSAQSYLVAPLMKDATAGPKVDRAQSSPAETPLPRFAIASNSDRKAGALGPESGGVVSKAGSAILGTPSVPPSPLIDDTRGVYASSDAPKTTDSIEPADVTDLMVAVETEPTARTRLSTEVASGINTDSVRAVSDPLAQGAESLETGSGLQPGARPPMVDPSGVTPDSNDRSHNVETASETPANRVNQTDGTIAVHDSADGLRQATQVSADLVSSDEIEFLLKRGDQYLETGDVAAARHFYERAAGAGSRKAATGVGKTYDPLFLAQIGVRGLRGGVELASLWYRKASAAGDHEAEARLKTLLSTPAQ